MMSDECIVALKSLEAPYEASRPCLKADENLEIRIFSDTLYV